MISARGLNITFRTAHIAAMGILLGGYAFDVEPSRLVPSLLICVVTGFALGGVESGFRLVWFHQGRGLTTIAKLLLLFAVPLLQNYSSCRLTLLLVVVVIASIASHMPARFRYYSILYGEVVDSHNGPGTAQLDAAQLDAAQLDTAQLDAAQLDTAQLDTDATGQQTGEQDST